MAPVLKKKILCFDLDNVICTTIKTNYNLSKKKNNIVKLINKLYADGYIIKIFTARFMGRNKEKISIAKSEGYSFTKKQLKKWGLKYHKLYFGKPVYDVFVDDKNFEFNKNWHIKFEKHYLKN